MVSLDSLSLTYFFYSLKLASINRDVRLGKELQSHAKLAELFKNFSNSLLVFHKAMG